MQREVPCIYSNNGTNEKAPFDDHHDLGIPSVFNLNLAIPNAGKLLIHDGVLQ